MEYKHKNMFSEWMSLVSEFVQRMFITPIYFLARFFLEKLVPLIYICMHLKTKS